jgi:hypothetical protein
VKFRPILRSTTLLALQSIWYHFIIFSYPIAIYFRHLQPWQPCLQPAPFPPPSGYHHWPLPVSKITAKLCGGVPTFRSLCAAPEVHFPKANLS